MLYAAPHMSRFSPHCAYFCPHTGYWTPLATESDAVRPERPKYSVWRDEMRGACVGTRAEPLLCRRTAAQTDTWQNIFSANAKKPNSSSRRFDGEQRCAPAQLEVFWGFSRADEEVWGLFFGGNDWFGRDIGREASNSHEDASKGEDTRQQLSACTIAHKRVHRSQLS